MHWRYEWVRALPYDVYVELVAMLQAESKPDAGTPALDDLR